MGSELTRYATWLRTALGLRDPELPRQLVTDGVLSTVDLLSAGIRDGEAMRFVQNNVLNGPLGGTDITLFSNGEFGMASGAFGTLYTGDWGWIGYISVEQAGGAAVTFSTRYWVKPQSGSPVYAFLVRPNSLGAGSHLVHSQLTGSPRPLVLPANTALHFDYSAVAAGASIQTNAVGIRIPVGQMREFF